MQFGRSYEEFEVGATYKHWPGKTVTEYDDHLFCLLTMNHHPLHLDVNYAEETTQFGKNVVVGNYVYSILLGMSVPDISRQGDRQPGDRVAAPRRADLPRRHDLRRDDGPRQVGATSKDDRGVVHVETIGYNQDGKVVCIFRRKVMVPKNNYLEAARRRAARRVRCRSRTRTGPAPRRGDHPEGLRGHPPDWGSDLAHVWCVWQGPAGDFARHRALRPPRTGRFLRPTPRPRQPVRRRDVGALQLLRHAGDRPAVPVLLGGRRRPGHGRGHRERGVGAYGGLVYLSTIPGAWLADRVLGSERTLFYSACLIMLGHVALSVLPGYAGVVAGLLMVGIG